MKNEQKNIEKATRRFCEKVDGPSVRLLYARTQTAELALELGLTVKQIENYVYRHNFEPWARKDPAFLSMENSKNGKRGGRPKKKFSAKKANTFLDSENLCNFAAESSTEASATCGNEETPPRQASATCGNEETPPRQTSATCGNEETPPRQTSATCGNEKTTPR